MRIPLILIALTLALGHAPRSPFPSPPTAEEIWNLTLPEAIRLGLDHRESVGVISCVKVGDRLIPFAELDQLSKEIFKDDPRIDCFPMGAALIPLGSFEPTPPGSEAGTFGLPSRP